MPDIVSFDPVRRLIVELPSGSPMLATNDNEIEWDEIYSEWKVWMMGSGGAAESPEKPNAGWPPAFRPVGGDPTSDVGALGSTFFLLNNWKFKPAEGSHTVQINGNTFTDPFGFATTVATDGAFTVDIKQFLSNIVQQFTLTDQDQLTIAVQSLIGNADVRADDLLVTIYANDGASPQTVLRTLSVSADGRVRRIVS